VTKSNPLIFTKPFFTLLALGLIFILEGLGLFFRPHLFAEIVNYLPTTISLLELTPTPSERVGVTLGSNYLAMTGLICFFLAFSPKKRMLYSIGIISSLLLTTSFFYLFLTEVKAFSYLLFSLSGIFYLLVIIWAMIYRPPLPKRSPKPASSAEN